MHTLVEKGLSGGPDAWRTLHMLTYNKGDQWIAEDLLKQRMWVAPDDYHALHSCIENDAVETAALLLDGGIDFDIYQQWAKNHPCCGHEETLQALSDHWTELKAAQEQEQDSAPQQAGGMTLG